MSTWNPPFLPNLAFTAFGLYIINILITTRGLVDKRRGPIERNRGDRFREAFVEISLSRTMLFRRLKRGDCVDRTRKSHQHHPTFVLVDCALPVRRVVIQKRPGKRVESLLVRAQIRVTEADEVERIRRFGGRTRGKIELADGIFGEAHFSIGDAQVVVGLRIVIVDGFGNPFFELAEHLIDGDLKILSRGKNVVEQVAQIADFFRERFFKRLLPRGWRIGLTRFAGVDPGEHPHRPRGIVELVVKLGEDFARFVEELLLNEELSLFHLVGVKLRGRIVFETVSLL